MNYLLVLNEEKSAELIEIVDYSDCQIMFVDKFNFYDDGGISTTKATFELPHGYGVEENELYEIFEVSKVYYNYLMDNTGEIERIVREKL